MHQINKYIRRKVTKEGLVGGIKAYWKTIDAIKDVPGN